MNFQEIKTILDANGVTLNDFARGRNLNLPEIGESKEVQQKGGEGEGEEWYSVRYFKDHDIFIRIDGWYQSYEGTTFENDYYEVFPKQVTITEYLP